ncbi:MULTISPECIES: hypothetical protein [Eikenella]|uniref:hypothetical protein n=1 Tax=Eikenella TaxID=538 RepID=UPI000A6029B7|nr:MULTISPECIES: hypothetical protein [Eikenella]
MDAFRAAVWPGAFPLRIFKSIGRRTLAADPGRNITQQEACRQLIFMGNTQSGYLKNLPEAFFGSDIPC